jgi:uncharacterized ubiquitin-like protein YukD
MSKPFSLETFLRFEQDLVDWAEAQYNLTIPQELTADDVVEILANIASQLVEYPG